MVFAEAPQAPPHIFHGSCALCWPYFALSRLIRVVISLQKENQAAWPGSPVECKLRTWNGVVAEAGSGHQALEVR